MRQRVIFWLCTGVIWFGFCIGSMKANPLENRFIKTGKVHVRDTFKTKDRSLFFRLKTFQIMILGRNAPEGLFQVNVILQTQTSAAHKLLESRLVQLYDVLFQDFYGIAPFFLNTGYTPNLESLRKRALRILHKHGFKSVSDVLLERAFVKPMHSILRQD